MISEIFYRNGGVDPFPIPESEDFIHVHGKDPVALYSPFCSSEASGYYYWKSKDRAFRVELRIPANVTGHSGDRDRFAHGHHAGVGFVL
tara:strand:- start:149 stop:415 length:267 start_codon:yes stop_codon:yes gene_type:complete